MGYTILLVDDSSVIRSLLKKAMSLLELDITKYYEASNGKEALDLFTKNADITMIVTDINMPMMSGLEFLAQIPIAKRIKIPIFVISTDENQEVIAQCEKLNVDAFIAKPFMPHTLKGIFYRELAKYEH